MRTREEAGTGMSMGGVMEATMGMLLDRWVTESVVRYCE